MKSVWLILLICVMASFAFIRSDFYLEASDTAQIHNDINSQFTIISPGFGLIGDKPPAQEPILPDIPESGVVTGLSHGEQYYAIDNTFLYEDTEMEVPTATLGEHTSNLRNEKWEEWVIVEKTRAVWNSDFSCSNFTVYNESTGKQETVEGCSDKGYNSYETYEAGEWREIGGTFTAHAGQIDHLRYSADYDMAKTGKGWGVAIDIIPSVTNEGETYDYPEYAWWSASYAHRMPINCTNMANAKLVTINGTTGFSFNGTKQVVQTTCQAGIYLYYNNDTSYAVANDTTEIPTNVESGNGTSYNPTTVFTEDTSLWAFLPLSETSGNAIDASNQHNFSLVGTVAGQTGYIDGARGQYSSANYFNNTATPFNSSNSYTICLWTKPTKNGPNGQAFLTTPTGSTWYVRLEYNTSTANYWQFWNYKAGNPTKVVYWYNPATTSNWYFLCGTQNATNSTTQTIAIYGNGALANTTAVNEGASAQASPIYLGILPSNFYLTNFTMDNFIAYVSADQSGAKSAAFIDELYKNGLGTGGYGTLEASEDPSNAAPTIPSITLTPTTAYYNDPLSNLTCAWTANDADSQYLNETIWWYKDGAIQDNLNVTYTNVLANSSNSTILRFGNFTAGDKWECIVNVTDGTLTAQNNSANVTIIPYPAVATISSPTNTTYNNSNINITATCGAGFANYNLTIDDSGATNSYLVANNTAHTNITAEADGTHTVTATCVNGSYSGSASVTYTLDATPPTITIHTPTNTTYSEGYITVNVTATDVHLNDTWYSTDGGATNTTYTTSINVSLADGGYTLIVYANDTFGNMNSTSISFTVYNSSVDSCREITVSGSYTLTDDLNSSGVNCIQVFESGVGIDCDNHKIFGTDNESDEIGIYLEDVNNTHIENCAFEDIGWGVYTEYGDNITINNISASASDYIIQAYHSISMSASNLKGENLIDGILFDQDDISGTTGSFTNISIYDEAAHGEYIDITTYSSADFQNLTLGYNSSIGIANWNSVSMGEEVVTADDVLLQPDFISVDDTLHTALNTTASLTISTDAGCINTVVYKGLGFPTTIAGILNGTRMAIPVTCAGGIANFTVPSFSGYALGGERPIITPLNLTPTTAYVDSTLTAAFTVMDNDSATINATVYWYKDGSLEPTLNVTFDDMPANTSNSTTLSGIFTQGEVWGFVVNVTDGLMNASNYSNNVTILNRNPYMRNLTLDPTYPQDSDNLNCSLYVYDDDDDLLDVTFRWYKNGTIQNALNDTQTSIANGSYVSTLLDAGNTTIGDLWSCNASVTDSLATISNMTVNRTIYPPATTNVTLNASYETGQNTAVLTIGANATIYNYTYNFTYNGTIVSSGSGAGNGSSVILYATVVSPLISTASKNISYDFTAILNTSIGILVSNVTGNQNVTEWYNAAKFNQSAAVTTIENGTTITINQPAIATGAITYPTITSDVYLDYCRQGLGNATYINTTCEGAAVTQVTPFLHFLSASHLYKNMTIYQEYYVNKTINITFAQTPESTSFKQIDIAGTNTSREYLAWLVNTSNMTYDGYTITNVTNKTTLFDIRFYDELTLNPLVIDSAVATFYLQFSDGEEKNFTQIRADVNNLTVRAYPNSYVANVSSVEIYSNASYAARSRFMLNAATPFNTTQNISVYLLPLASATYTTITVINNGNPVPSSTIQILKYYASTGGYINVDTVVTNGNGQAVSYLDATAYYKFNAYDSSGTLIYSSTLPERLICASTCTITLYASTQNALNYVSPSGIADCYGNSTTNSIIFSYSDYTGLTTGVNFLAWRKGNSTNYSNTVCNYTVSASTAGYACILPAGENLTRYEYICMVRSAASPYKTNLVKIISMLVKSLSPNGAFLAIFGIIALATIGFNPVIGIILSCIGLVVMNALGIITLGGDVMAGILLAGGMVVILILPREVN